MLELASLFEFVLHAAEEHLALLAQPPELEAAIHECQQDAPVERLLDEVEGPFVDRLDQVVVRFLGVARHQDDIDVAQSGFQAARDLEACHFGHADVDDRQVGPHALGLFEGRGPRGDARDVMPAAQDAGQGVQDARLVVDEQDAGSMRFHSHVASSRCRGNEARTRVPEPGALSMCNCPRICATIDRQMASPSPWPLALVVKKGSWILARCSGGMPQPVSSTTSSRDPAVALALIVSRSPAAGRVSRVADQIEEELLDVGLDGEKGGQIGRNLDRERHPAPLEALAQDRQHAVGDVTERDLAGIAGGAACDIEHPAEDAAADLDRALELGEVDGGDRWV